MVAGVIVFETDKDGRTGLFVLAQNFCATAFARIVGYPSQQLKLSISREPARLKK